jgi:mRNA interferase MazF
VTIDQYDWYWVAIELENDEPIGAEMRKNRSGIILSPNEMNKTLKTVIMAPVTTKVHAEIPTRVIFKSKGVEYSIALDQMRSIDKSRIKNAIGVMDKRTIAEIKHKIHEMLVL